MRPHDWPRRKGAAPPPSLSPPVHPPACPPLPYAATSRQVWPPAGPGRAPARPVIVRTGLEIPPGRLTRAAGGSSAPGPALSPAPPRSRPGAGRFRRPVSSAETGFSPARAAPPPRAGRRGRPRGSGAGPPRGLAGPGRRAPARRSGREGRAMPAAGDDDPQLLGMIAVG